MNSQNGLHVLFELKNTINAFLGFSYHQSNAVFFLQCSFLLYSIPILIANFVSSPISINLKEFKSVKLSPLKCLPSGWPAEGTKLLWPFYYYPEMPSIQDAFEDNGKITIVLSCEFIKTHSHNRHRLQFAMKHRWALFLHKDNFSRPINPDNPLISQQLTGYSKRGKMFPLNFELPEDYQNRFNFATIQLIINKSFETFQEPNENEVTFNPQYQPAETEFQGFQNYTKIFKTPIRDETLRNYGITYRYIPFCPILDKYSRYENNGHQPNKSFLRICTQNLIFEDYERNVDILRWALYHISQGFDTPILYYNKIIPKDNHQATNEIEYEEIKQRTLKLFQPAIDQKVIELVSFEFPYAFYFHDELAQEMSCLRRNLNRTVWLGMNDVDEYFYSYSNDVTISESIQRFTNEDFFSTYGGLVAPNLFMKAMSDGIVRQDSKMNFHERTKCIIIPDNVNQYVIHKIVSGYKGYLLSDRSIINAHFKKMPTYHYQGLKEDPRMTALYQQCERKAIELLTSSSLSN